MGAGVGPPRSMEERRRIFRRVISEKAKSVEMKTENEDESDAKGISMEGREWNFFSFSFSFFSFFIFLMKQWWRFLTVKIQLRISIYKENNFYLFDFNSYL